MLHGLTDTIRALVVREVAEAMDIDQMANPNVRKAVLAIKYAWNPLQGSGRFPPEPGSNDVKEKEMLTAQEKARILAKIRKDSYGITLEQMKQYFIEHQHAREIGDKKMMEKIEYHLTYINFHYECGLLATGQYDKLPEVIKNW